MSKQHWGLEEEGNEKGEEEDGDNYDGANYECDMVMVMTIKVLFMVK